MNLDDALQTFISESRELLDNMEQALLRIEQAPHDSDLVNAIFRAAHTIKGSAGLFGIDHLVVFTHSAENLLDKLRAAELQITRELVALLLEVCDHIGTLIELVAQKQAPGSEVHQHSQTLMERIQLSAHACATPPSAEPEQAAPAPAAVATSPAAPDNASDCATTSHWHISLRFGPQVLRDGMDPVAFLQYLGTLGQIIHIVTLSEAIPNPEEMNPEDCYLGFEICYDSQADQAAIENVFEFVRHDAQIRILPPHSPLADYFIGHDGSAQAQQQHSQRLVECASLTRTEAEAYLRAHLSTEADPAVATTATAAPAPPPPAPAATSSSSSSSTAVLAPARPKENKSSPDAGLIRVNAQTLDEHINLVGELIIASASVNLCALKSASPELLEAASVMNRLVENVRDSALQLRMVQIGATFNKFQRVVRDVSKEIGKDIALEISGAETELDKTVVEKISDPLTHLVRNSIDHGIEPADVRLARGKPAQGTLRLHAYHESGSIVIEVSDDGGGLPKERILAKAIERGLVKPEQTLSDNEIHQLIFEPGFSTADQVNNLSGRGVGMDVVRRNITALRGSTEIDSTEGVGTTIRIRLPLTLAIIDGFLVGVGGSSFVIPLDMLDECVELTTEEMQAAQGRDQLNLRGELLPFIRLKQLFAIADTPPPVPSEQDLSNLDPELAFLLQPVLRENVVVVNCAGRRAGLVVDTLQGEHQTVIRPLGAVFQGIACISGFTILGTGRVALIIDVPSLVQYVTHRDGRQYHSSGHKAPAP
ncbi:MAG: chemotaxis protein CheA [Giesbergeria sp.]|uniref:chemotaxis protein CheA n=1 Tax=Giesbergeria sp. TaxID=2818473 RepID=UPI002630625C|nr:chemotaxis protein CheA [Giesbergeria sp.]MDD2609938.1 chemotaxis protein CheA [Giesbergeria sp.]